MSIDTLPDASGALLEIFGFCAACAGEGQAGLGTKKVIQAWQSPAHVSRRWRSVVFGPPHRP